MNIFPYCLVRIAGASFDLIPEGIPSIYDWMRKIEDDRKSLSIEKEHISQLIYSEVNSTADDDYRQLLINIRRKIFNAKKLSPREQDDITRMVPASLRSKIENYYTALSGIATSDDALDTHIHTETMLIRKQLLEHYKNEYFTKGLLLGSHTLLDSLERLQQKDITAWSGRDTHTENGLIRYFSRMIAKTSPFSTFTHLMLGRMSKQQDNTVDFGNSNLSVYSDVQLNNYILRYLRNLLLKLPAFTQHLVLITNSTLKESKEGKYKFLLNNNNSEVIQEIEASPIIDFILEDLQSHIGRTRIELVRDFGEIIDADTAEIERYLDKLINTGIVEYDWPVSGRDLNWLQSLSVLVNDIASKAESAILVAFGASIQKIQGFMQRYPVSPTGERRKIQYEMFDTLMDIYLKLHEAADLEPEERIKMEKFVAYVHSNGAHAPVKKKAAQKQETAVNEGEAYVMQHDTILRIKPECLFFEDSINTTTVELPQQYFEQLKPVLIQAQNFFFYLHAHQAQQISFREHFLSTYGEESSIPFLRVYEDFFRNVNSGKIKLYAEEAMGVLNGPVFDQLYDYISKYYEEMSSTGVLNLELDVLTHQQALDSYADEIKHSFCCFMQIPYSSASGEMGIPIINGHMMSGYGKLYSRFLHLFDPSLEEELVKHNKESAGTHVLSENNDASYFNANIHPALLDHEAAYPGAHNLLDQGNRIEVGDLSVKYDVIKDKLVLENSKTATPVLFLNLGFQSDAGRSPLFKILGLFGPAFQYLNLPAPVTEIIRKVILEKQFNGDISRFSEGIVVFPRIYLSNKLMISRKKWWIHPACYPQISETDDMPAKLKAISNWRNRYQLPEEVFVKVPDNIFNEAVGKSDAIRYDDMKPQYIQFNNPVFINLFCKLLQAGYGGIEIEEMYPSREMLAEINGKKYVTEYLVQWNS